MRPLLVISLVIIAVAVLLFSIFALDGNTDPEPVLAETAPTVQTSRPDAPVAEDLTQPKTIDRPKVESDRRAISQDNERVAVAQSTENFDNSLSGRVLDPDGLPIEGASLLLTEGGIQSGMLELRRAMGALADRTKRKRSTKTDADGRYAFKNLKPGDYSLVTKHEEFSQYRDNMVPVAFVGETHWDITLREGIMLHGYVHSIEGGPIEKATIVLSSSITPALMNPRKDHEADTEFTVETNAQGYYRFLNLTPDESWHLSASADTFGTQTERNLLVDGANGTNTVDFRLSPGETLAGIVLGPDRSPVEGAVIRVIGYQQPQTLSSEGITNAAGRFEIPNLVSGSYALIANAEGLKTERLNRVEAPKSDIQIELAEQGTVMGRVVGLSGEPVVSFTLSLHQYIANSAAYGRKVKEKKFDSEDGTFTLTGVNEGRFSIKVAAAGYADTYSEDFEVTQGLTTTDVLIQMSSGGTIVGIVVNATTGEPLSGAVITTQDNNFQDNPLMRMFGDGMPRRTTPQNTRSGKDGRFELSMLAPEIYQIQVQHPQFPLATLNNLRVSEGVPTDAGKIQLLPGSTIRGIVYDEAGDPLSGATVQLRSTADDFDMHMEARSNSEGRFILRNVPEGSYNLCGSRPSKGGDIFGPIVDIKNSEVNFRIGRGQEFTQDLNLGGRSQ